MDEFLAAHPETTNIKLAYVDDVAVLVEAQKVREPEQRLLTATEKTEE